MSGSTFGNLFKVTTWGESHGAALGVVIDGCPAGLPLSPTQIQKDLDRRRPGMSALATPRAEADAVQILSGVFEGKTTGTPVSLVIYNENQRSGDYDTLKDVYRPGHADYGYEVKYAHRDWRGGGRSSGRETAARVAAGAVAKLVLAQAGIDFTTYLCSLGSVTVTRKDFDPAQASRNPFVLPGWQAAKDAEIFLRMSKISGDSVGGTAECIISGVPPGIGEPVFDKLDAAIAQAVFSIGGVKGVEFGAGFAAAGLKGSVNNDGFYFDNGIKKRTNNSGGVLGGLSDGGDIVFRAAMKPTPSIKQSQKTVNKAGDNIDITIDGRHDFAFAPRAVIVVECMAALALLDLMMQNMTCRIDYFKNFYTDSD